MRREVQCDEKVIHEYVSSVQGDDLGKITKEFGVGVHNPEVFVVLKTENAATVKPIEEWSELEKKRAIKERDLVRINNMEELRLQWDDVPKLQEILEKYNFDALWHDFDALWRRKSLLRQLPKDQSLYNDKFMDFYKKTKFPFLLMIKRMLVFMEKRHKENGQTSFNFYGDTQLLGAEQFQLSRMDIAPSAMLEQTENRVENIIEFKEN